MIEEPDIPALAAARYEIPRKSDMYFGDKQKTGQRGISAELFFARAFGLPYDKKRATQQFNGDGGIDFEIPLKGWRRPLTVDVKGTACKDFDLLVKVSQLRYHAPPDIYVGVGFYPEGHAFFTGWLPGRAILGMPVKDFGYGPGTEAYACPRSKLWSMGDLCTLLALRTDLKYTGHK